MRKNLFTLMVITLIAAGPAFAHCGKCGVADDHSHATEVPTGDIVAVATSNGSFTTLIAAVEAAGLAQTLQTDGPFTVFAPTDDAFAKLPEGTLESFLANPIKLKQILLYHVIPGTVKAAEVATLSSATTAQGSAAAISVNEGTVMVDNAKVVKTDVMASNGVIHVIDSVIIPSS